MKDKLAMVCENKNICRLYNVLGDDEANHNLTPSIDLYVFTCGKRLGLETRTLIT